MSYNPGTSSSKQPQGNGTGKLGRAETAPQLSPFLWVTQENPVNVTESREGERPRDMGVWVTGTGVLCTCYNEDGAHLLGSLGTFGVRMDSEGLAKLPEES